MARKKTFPITTKVGATAIRIYKDPLRFVRNGKKVEFDSFLVSYYRGGQRIRKRCKSLGAAEKEVKLISTAVENEDLAALRLTGKERIVYGMATEAAASMDTTLDMLAKECVAAKKLLGKTSIIEAAEFYHRYGRSVTDKKMVSEVVDELIAGLKADKLSDYHIGDMKRRLQTFALKFPKPIMGVRTKEIVEWLRELKNKEKEDQSIAPKTRNHYRNSVVQLFNFARDHGYLPKGLPTEAEAVKTVSVVPSANEIFAIDEMITLLSGASEHLLAPIAIKAFSGIRTEEMMRLKWEHINWTSGHIVLPAEVTKTSQRRMIPIPENLRLWIEQFKGRSGRISNRWKRPQALFQAFDRFGKRVGVNVGANKFRNSYISYRVAVTHDVQRVALESGNSPRVIQREYLELATEADGKLWFQIVPGMKPATTPAKRKQPPRRVLKTQAAAAIDASQSNKPILTAAIPETGAPSAP